MSYLAVAGGDASRPRRGAAKGAVCQEEILVSHGESVGEEVAELGLRPSFEDELGREVEIGAGVHAVRNARRFFDRLRTSPGAYLQPGEGCRVFKQRAQFAKALGISS